MMISIDQKIIVEKARNGRPSLKVVCEDKSIKTLHSTYDPEAEARNIIDGLQYNGNGIIIVLGLGLGYHVAELRRQFPDDRIVVIEALSEICRFATEYGPDLNSDIKVITDSSPSEVINEIAREQSEMGLVPLSVLTLSSAVSAFPEYYNPILESLTKTASVKLWDRLRYKKFKQESLNVMLIDSGYFLTKEVNKAIQQLGHNVLKVKVNEEDDVMSALMGKILEFKPDFLLTINHLGFDEDGVLTSFFNSIQLPVASWYVDSPSLIVKSFNKNISPFVSLFLWDKSYINEMESIGFESVRYLPMGTYEGVFRTFHAGKHRKKLMRYECDVGFVGNSLVEKTNEIMERIPGALNDMIEKAAGNLSTDRSLVQETIERVDAHVSDKERTDVEAAILWKAALLYRLSCIKKMRRFDICVHGDDGWKELLDSSYCIKPPLNYYKELPYFYNACKINFNATHIQMSEAVNQRVFDVPACGSFILTDDQEALYDLFHVGDDIITFKDKEEIPDLVEFYLKHPDTRKSIALKGRARVLNNHTYTHRLKNMIEFMKERYS